MNLPNTLTLSRIFFVPVLLAVMLSDPFEVDLGSGWTISGEWIALVIFLTAATTDFLDGYLARRRRQVTVFGKLLDPIADKLLVSGAFISLVELGRVPAWVVVLIVGREFAVSGLRYVALTNGVTISASYLGKGKMAAQVTAIALLLIAPYDPWISQVAYLAVVAAVILTVLSMVDYFRAFWNSGDEALPKDEAELLLARKARKSAS